MNDNIMELKILEHSDFGEIRTSVDENGNILFGASDVAKALGYAKPNNAVQTHCRATLKQGSPISGKIQEINFIYEPDVYRLITKSKLPSAQEFERWVFEDVLPSLRKYGMYATDELLENEEKLLVMVEKLKSEKSTLKLQKAKASKLRKENKMLKQDLKFLNLAKEGMVDALIEQFPLVDFAENVLNSDLDMTVTQIAADYGLSAYQLNIILNEVGLQRKVNNQWVLYKKFMNRGFTTSYTSFHEKNDHYYVQTLWTQKGRFLIHEILSDIGYESINSMEVV